VLIFAGYLFLHRYSHRAATQFFLHRVEAPHRPCPAEEKQASSLSPSAA